MSSSLHFGSGQPVVPRLCQTPPLIRLLPAAVVVLLRQVSDCLEKVRGLVKRRRDTSNSKSQTAAAPQPVGRGQALTAADRLATSPCSLSASSSPAFPTGSQSSKSKKHRGSAGAASSSTSASDVWHHDASIILPPQMEVAALIDKDSEPQLWILAAVLGYKALPRPRYTVVDLDPGDESGGGGGGEVERGRKGRRAGRLPSNTSSSPAR